MNWLITQLRKPEWSPYVAGAGLGLVTILALVLSSALLPAPVLIGASGAYENLVAPAGLAVDPKNTYFNYIMPPGLTWSVWILAGVFLGGLASALLSRTFKWRALPDRQWTEIFGKSVVKRWAIVFLAAVLLEYAAGIAGGCTSGLAISGGVVLAPASFIFIAGMFASGIVTAMLLYRKKY
ncbi:MAG TPA: YeeE/YedE thiosulfate transporter family protein [Anaerolineae bacterium]|nr:YeeE/YedE thiosulfate transporter family protein [Anaerolineae bacterium]